MAISYYDVRIISDQKVFVCSIALATERSILLLEQYYEALIITIQPDTILR